MKSFPYGTLTVVSLEVKQRLRSRVWYILLGIFGAVLTLLTLGLAATGEIFTGVDDTGGYLFSFFVFLVLMLGMLVTPAVSGNAINGDRDAGTLATTQVTQVSTTQIVLGKFIAAWLSALAFLAVAAPFLALSLLSGGSLTSALASLPFLALELGVVAAIGVGLSGLVQRSLFSVACTYLLVAAMSLGTLLAFGIATVATTSEVTVSATSIDWNRTQVDPETGDVVGELFCTPPQLSTEDVVRHELTWPILAANPFVAISDAIPPSFNGDGSPDDFFTSIAATVRRLQIPAEVETERNDCQLSYDYTDYETDEEIYQRTVPSWFVGLGIHLVVGGSALAGAIAVNRTPASRLAKGSRIA